MNQKIKIIILCIIAILLMSGRVDNNRVINAKENTPLIKAELIKENTSDIVQQTSVTVYYMSTYEDELIKTEEITGLTVGESYTHEAIYVFHINEKRLSYYFAKEEDNVLTINVLSAEAEKNKIIIYYNPSEEIGYGTYVYIEAKDADTDELIKSKRIIGMSIGRKYSHSPETSFVSGQNKMYMFDMDNNKNRLYIESLHASPYYNVITVYYINVQTPGTATKATIQYRDADTKELIKTEEVNGLKSADSYIHTPVSSFTLNEATTYTYDSTNTGNSVSMDILRADAKYNVITLYYKKNFQPCNISKTTVKIPKVTYTGKKVSPSLKLTYKYNNTTKQLVKNQDYTITFKNAKNIGTATAVIKGIGNYTGTKKVTFTIRPKSNKIKSLKNKNGKLTVTFTKSKGATGYEVLCATNKQFKSAKKKTVKRTSMIWKGLKKGKTYYVKVRAYKKVKGKKVYGIYSSVKKVK